MKRLSLLIGVSKKQCFEHFTQIKYWFLHRQGTINQIVFGVSLILVLSSGLNAEEQIKAVCEPNEASVGSSVHYSVTFTTGSEKFEIKKLDDRYYQDTSANDADKEQKIPLFIIEDFNTKSEALKGEYLITIDVTVIPLIPGEYDLPLVDITDEDGIAFGYKAPHLKVTQLNQSGKLEDIEPPVHRSGNYVRLIMLILAIIAVSFAVYFLVKFILSRKKAKVEPEVTVPPLLLFKEAMKQLKSKGYLEAGDVESYCTEISSIFRLYLSSTLNFPAVEMTSDEIFSYLRKNIFSLQLSTEIKDLMVLWDLAKFAEMRPSVDTIVRNSDSTEALVYELEREDDHAV